MEARSRRTRRRLWWAAALVVVVLAAGAVAALAYPSVAAATCPRCYGLEPVRDGLYAERGLSTADRQRLVETYQEAVRRVDGFYGGRRSKPVVLACVTAGCYRRIGGGGERGIAILDRAVLLSPRGIDPVIAAHELSHVEFHERLGSRREQVPQWFDEGLAVLVAGDARYLLPSTAGDRCRDSAPGPLPRTHPQWLAAATADEQVYARAACRVFRWTAARGGDRAVLDLVDRLRRGERFTDLVED
ncbi:hypothetical protein [Micromonospora auratinigra]|uniref:Peptidase MA superfamily n=1 Tax=Micromonospora auratinigra TaxID=261654 RepID=A0A1A8Z9D0_9ACTN|nr:hypothetical protein [Micromonospora auratinigra]SBT40466.1 Peptidase MA superfamily [Micromonospora auratinigra]